MKLGEGSFLSVTYILIVSGDLCGDIVMIYFKFDLFLLVFILGEHEIRLVL